MTAPVGIRRIASVTLRVNAVQEAAPRWSSEFGLSPAERRDDRVRLRCAYEPHSLELVEGDPGHERTTFELAWWCSLEEAAARLAAYGVPYELTEAALRFVDPDGNGLELVPFREGEDTRPAVARHTTSLPAFHPRRLGHVNVLSRDLQALADFYADVLGMRVSDRLGDGAAVWLSVDADHHAMAGVAHETPCFHHLAFELTDWGELRVALDHLAQRGRWLSWGPVRHPIGQNLCAYVRIPEERCLVELYCDMEQLAAGHVPRDWPDEVRSANTWGIMPPRSYFRFDEAALESERLGLEALGVPLATIQEVSR